MAPTPFVGGRLYDNWYGYFSTLAMTMSLIKKR